MRRYWFFRLLANVILLFAVSAAPAGERFYAWLDQAADPELSPRRRDFALQQSLMLADASASMFISILRDDDPQAGGRRRLAARLLGEPGYAGAEAALSQALLSTDYFLAFEAAHSLARIYSRLSDEELLALLEQGGRELDPALTGEPGDADDWLALSLGEAENRSRIRALALRGLAMKYRGKPGIMPPALAKWIWEGLLDGDKLFRAAALEAAPVSGSDAAPEKLSAFLFTENDSVLLRAALAAMGELRPPAYSEGVERQAGHADPLVALEALAALGAMGYENALFPSPGGNPALTVAGFVNHPSTPVRRRVIALLAATKDPRAAEYLARSLRDRVGINREAAAEAIGRLGFTAGIGALSPLLGDLNPEVRSAAALALDKLGVVGVSARMLDDLEGDDPLLRRSAAVALGKLGDKRAAVYLVRALTDSDPELAANAAEALGRLGDRRAAGGLYRCLTGHDDPMVADAARQALARLYNDDPGDTASGWDSWLRRNNPAPAPGNGGK